MVADNIGSMKDRMLPQLGAAFPGWFQLGCVPHVLDLLIEDIAKIREIESTIGLCHMIIIFTKRWSIVYEAFISKKTHKMGFRLFSLTRFAYAYLLVHSVCLHLPVLSTVSEWPEYIAVKAKTIKSTKVSKRAEKRREFTAFEQACQDWGKKRKSLAVVALLKPLSKTLHHLEGDNVPPSHVLPLFCSWLQYSRNLPDSVTEALSSETCTRVVQLTEARWLGSARKVGLRADLDCLTFLTGPTVRAITRRLGRM